MSARIPYVCDGSSPLAPQLLGSVMVLGSFDGLHRGHQMLVSAARRIAHGRLVSVLQCDPHPRQFFGRRGRFRISTGAAQHHLLTAVGTGLIYAPRFDAAFAATSAPEFVCGHLVGLLGVSAVVVGNDFRFGRGCEGDVDLLEALGRKFGFGVLRVPDNCEAGVRISSSQIRDHLAAGDIAQAVSLLGHPWILATRIGADGLWRFDETQILPPPGNYKLRVLDMHGQRSQLACGEMKADGIRLSGIMGVAPELLIALTS